MVIVALSLSLSLPPPPVVYFAVSSVIFLFYNVMGLHFLYTQLVHVQMHTNRRTDRAYFHRCPNYVCT